MGTKPAPRAGGAAAAAPRLLPRAGPDGARRAGGRPRRGGGQLVRGRRVVVEVGVPAVVSELSLGELGLRELPGRDAGTGAGPGLRLGGGPLGRAAARRAR